jgi:spore maturation protein CgeB
MKIALFYHSLLSDWNHGNAHFLRGITWELRKRGHEVQVFEPEDGWSLNHLLADHGRNPLQEFYKTYPGLDSIQYRLDQLDLERLVADADLVLVHEWNDPGLVRRIGDLRKAGGDFRLLFHDTHHRSVTAPETMAAYDLSGYDGVLAYGRAIAEIYLRQGWTRRAWVWHEAADTRVFRPLRSGTLEGDLIWIGNWGDEERSAELREFLIEPVKALKLRARIYGVRYPAEALNALQDAGIEYGGWLPNFRVPEVFGRFRVTVHVQRRPYAERLPGIPTIRPFEALSCAIPLICSPWEDTEGLFTPGKDFLIATNGTQMKRHLRSVLDDAELAASLTAHGRETVLSRHTCAHRVDELMAIYTSLCSSKQSINDGRERPSVVM